MGLFSSFRKNKQDADAGDDLDAPVKRRSRRPAVEADDPLDPVLPEKKRARRRLIGATALVLAAIIGLPMIFDSEPKPLADDIAIQIPSRDKPLPQVAAAVAVQPIAATAPAAVPEAAVPTPPVSIPVETSKPEASKPEVTAKAAEAPAPVTEKSVKYIVQVAAITTKARANELQDKLKKAGIKSYSQKVDTNAGERIRVRVGPFTSKEEAEKMRARLVKLGLSGKVQPA